MKCSRSLVKRWPHHAALLGDNTVRLTNNPSPAGDSGRGSEAPGRLRTQSQYALRRGRDAATRQSRCKLQSNYFKRGRRSFFFSPFFQNKNTWLHKGDSWNINAVLFHLCPLRWITTYWRSGHGGGWGAPPTLSNSISGRDKCIGVCNEMCCDKRWLSGWWGGRGGGMAHKRIGTEITAEVQRFFSCCSPPRASALRRWLCLQNGEGNVRDFKVALSKTFLRDGLPLF